jgi:hypothetical protein
MAEDMLTIYPANVSETKSDQPPWFLSAPLVTRHCCTEIAFWMQFQSAVGGEMMRKGALLETD